MGDTAVLDRAFQFIMRRMVETGQAPHYTELAAGLGLPVEGGRRVLHELVATSHPAWLYSATDYLASFAPFSNFPTQYRVTSQGRQQWFAQCGFEAIGMTWVFPHETVRIDAPCLDCNEPIVLEMRDGELVRVDPPGVVGHQNQSRVIPSKEQLPFV
jgi:hypothetical protein